MPHIIVEYSPNIVEKVDFNAFFRNMHEALMELGAFKLADIKSRARVCEEYFVADGDPRNAFVHIEFALFGGRDLSVRQKTAERLMELLKETFGDSLEALICTLSVEVREMETETYLKLTSDQAHLSGA